MNDNAIEFAGFLGPHFILSASDFTISLAEIEQMDLLRQSHASVYDEVEQQTGVAGIEVLENDVLNKPGIYSVEFGLDQDVNVTKYIKVTVKDEPKTPLPPKPSPAPPKPNKPSNPVQPRNPDNPRKPDPARVLPINTGKNNANVPLPQTGEISRTNAVYAGLILLHLVLIIRAIIAKKKNKEQE